MNNDIYIILRNRLISRIIYKQDYNDYIMKLHYIFKSIITI